MSEEVGYNRSTLLEMLHSREVKIKFEKQDGSIRLMRATLVDEIIPPQQSGSKKRTKAVNTDLITAWDLDAQGWRSFHPESVLEAV